MPTKETIESYFAALQAHDGWEVYLAEEVAFTNYAAPVKRVVGREAFVDSTRGFYGMIETVDVRDLIVDGNMACAVTHYELQSPTGDSFISDVAEVFTVEDEKISVFSIFFDSAPFPS